MWRLIILIVLVHRTVLPQPVNKENVRETRQIDRECCPCPPSGKSGVSEQDAWSTQVQKMSPDNCPCPASFDSESASSIPRFSIRVVDQPFRPIDTTSEPKPLLKPEVGLASSVLETLREVTDQEYQEALERDAARNAIGALASSRSNEFDQHREGESSQNTVNPTTIDYKNQENCPQKQVIEKMPNEILDLSTKKEEDVDNNERSDDSSVGASQSNGMYVNSSPEMNKDVLAKFSDNSEEQQPENVQDSFIDNASKRVKNLCEKSFKSSHLAKSHFNMENDKESEMISEASSPVVSSFRHIVQPKSLEVKDLLGNFKTSAPKIAIPELLSIRLPTPMNRETSELRKSLGTNREIISPFNHLQNRMNTLTPLNLMSKLRNTDQRKDISVSRSQNPSALQNRMFPDDFHTRSENNLRNIQNVFDGTFTNPLIGSQNILSSTSPDGIYENIARTNDDLSEKFKAFHFDLNDKLSLFSQKLSDMSPSQLKSEPMFRSINTNSNFKQSNLPILNRNTPPSELKENALNINHKSFRKLDIPQKELTHKQYIPSKLTLDSNKSPTIMSPTTLKDEIKSSLRKEKFKPLNSKVTISFTTTARPKLMLKGKDPENPKSLKISETLASDEPRGSASEAVATKVLTSDRNSDNARKLPSHRNRSFLPDTSDGSLDYSHSEDDNDKNALALSRLRQAIKGLGDPTSIDSNIPLKENVSYKCKLICVKDKDPAK